MHWKLPVKKVGCYYTLIWKLPVTLQRPYMDTSKRRNRIQYCEEGRLQNCKSELQVTG
jgi:hypothetical protein